MIKHTNKSASGTAFFEDTITTSIGKLIELFPNSYRKNMSKTNYYFILENSDGNVFTIYDWKQPLPSLDEKIVLNIGGVTPEITEKAKQELSEII